MIIVQRTTYVAFSLHDGLELCCLFLIEIVAVAQELLVILLA